MKKTIGLLALATLLGACGGAAADAPLAGNVIRLPAEDRPLPPPATAYTVGAADGAEWESFTHIAHMAFDGDDNLYVLDRGAGKVFVFDSAGTFVRAIGKSGSGPGELTFPVQLAVTREGTVVVSDMRRRSFSLFRRDGTYLEELPFDFRRSLGGMEVRPHPRSGFVTVYQPRPGATPDTGHVRLVWQSVDIDDEPRVIAEVAADPRRLGAGIAAPNQPAFSHGFYWGVLPSGEAAVTHTAGYRIDIFSPDGRAARTLQRPIEPRSTTAADREAERKRRSAHMVGDMANAPPQVRQAVMEEMQRLTFAGIMPVIQEFGVDAHGRLWVRRGATPDGEDGKIDLIAADGTYLGTFPGARVPQAHSSGGRAAYVEEDELGVVRVVVRRVPRGWGAVASR
jgi:hypothetical protein